MARPALLFAATALTALGIATFAPHMMALAEPSVRTSRPEPGGPPPPDPTRDWTEDATRRDFNAALSLAWTRELGDYDERQPVGRMDLKDRDSEQVYRARVSGNNFIAVRTGGTNFSFHSRESDEPAKRPRLIVNGREEYIASRDAHLDRGTYKSLGKSKRIWTAGTMLIAFDDYRPKPGDSAELVLTADKDQYGNQTLTFYRPRPTIAPVAGAPQARTTRNFAYDQRAAAIAKRHVSPRTRMDIRGDTISVYVDEGRDHALGASIWPLLDLKDEAFFTYIMRIDRSWTPLVSGKFPGLARTHNSDLNFPDRSPNGGGGWGGRLADGDSWSARTYFSEHQADNPTARDWQSLGSYFYALKPQDRHGIIQHWSKPVPKNRWVAITQRVKLNTVMADGRVLDDGELSYWLDGEPVQHISGIRWRSVPGPISDARTAWLDVYIGGTGYDRRAHPPHRLDFARFIVADAMPDPALVGSYVRTLNGGR